MAAVDDSDDGSYHDDFSAAPKLKERIESIVQDLKVRYKLCDLETYKDDLKPQSKRLIMTLEKIQETEPDEHLHDNRLSNLLAILYKNDIAKVDHVAKVEKQYKQILGKDEFDIIGLLGAARWSLDQYQFDKVEDCVVRLEKMMLDNDVRLQWQIIQSKSTIAFCLRHISPKHLPEAKELMEDVLESMDKSGHFLDIVGKEKLLYFKALYCFSLGCILNMIMNKGNRHMLTKSDECKEDRHAHFRAIKHNLTCAYTCIGKGNEVLSTSTHFSIPARAHIELLDAFRKYETMGYKKDPCMESLPCLPEFNDAQTYHLEEAKTLGEEDPFVLGKLGRIQRTCSGTVKGFREAIAYFQKAVDISPSRHVEWHQMAEAYKSIWILEGDYEEKAIYRHKKSKKKSKKCKKGKPAQEQDKCVSLECMNSIPDSFGADSVYFDEDNPEPRSSGCNGGKIQLQTTGSDSFNADVDDTSHGDTTSEGCMYNSDSQNSSIDATPSPTSPLEKVPFKRHDSVVSDPCGALNKTITPKRRFGPREQPTNPDYFDKLRTSNPLVKNPRKPPQAFNDALQCYENANKHSGGQRSRYLTDLGRMYISFAKVDVAVSHFQKAEHAKKSSYVTAYDAAYLYEQWGLLKEEKANNNDDQVQKISLITAAKDLFRKSLSNSTAANEKSRVAFYHLRDLIQKQLNNSTHDHGNADKTAELEYQFLDVVSHHPKASKTMNLISEALLRNPDSANTLLELIILFSQQTSKTSGDGALQYLSMLVVQGHIEKVTRKDARSKILENVFSRQTLECLDITMPETRNFLQRFFRWLVPISSLQKSCANTEPIADDDQSDIILLAANFRQFPFLKDIYDVLTDNCSLSVKLVTQDQYSDIDLDKSFDESGEQLLRMAAHTRGLVYICDGQGEKWTSDAVFQKMVEDCAIEVKTTAKCYITNNNVDVHGGVWKSMKKLHLGDLLETGENSTDADGGGEGEVNRNEFKIIHEVFSNLAKCHQKCKK